MAKEETFSTALSFPGIGTEVQLVGGPIGTPSLKELRHQTLKSAGLLKERTKYASKEERKEAAKERSKERRLQRKAFLVEKGLDTPKRAKLTKEQKKTRSKEARKIRNAFLREHPEQAQKLGFDVNRLRVF